MSLTFQPVRVNTGFEEEGVLVFDEQQRLSAVLVHLSDQHEIAPGQWFLEVGFGPLDGASPPTFADLDAAQDWISQRHQLSDLMLHLTIPQSAPGLIRGWRNAVYCLFRKSGREKGRASA